MRFGSASLVALLVLPILPAFMAKAESTARSVEVSITVRSPEDSNSDKKDSAAGDEKAKPSLKYFLTMMPEGKSLARGELKKDEPLKPEDTPLTIALGSHSESFHKSFDAPDGNFDGSVFSRADDGPCQGMSESSFKNAQGCLPMPSQWHCSSVKISSGAKVLKSTCMQGSDK